MNGKRVNEVIPIMLCCTHSWCIAQLSADGSGCRDPQTDIMKREVSIGYLPSEMGNLLEKEVEIL